MQEGAQRAGVEVFHFNGDFSSEQQECHHRENQNLQAEKCHQTGAGGGRDTG